MESSIPKTVRVRFPPSPTGHPHLGMARTALFNWVFARQNKGAMVFRIEDTDENRSKPEYEKEIIDSLNWLGLDWDEGIGKEGNTVSYRQSERGDIYEGYIKKLLEEKKAFYCYCTKEELEIERNKMSSSGLPPVYSGKCRALTIPPEGKNPQVIRLLNPGINISFDDMIHGVISFDTKLFGDIVIAKTIHTPLYNLAVVVDDYEMRITHVIRGEDHISNTPKQILIQQALGFYEPRYAHLPLVLGADKKKLSKRYVETSLLAYREEGYLSEAIVNFLIMLGWHPKDNQEVFTREELIERFDLARVQKAGAIFDTDKLDWLNAQHMKKMDIESLYELLAPLLKEKNKEAPKELIMSALGAERERMKKLTDFLELGDFFFSLPEYEANLLRFRENDLKATLLVVNELISFFEGQDKPYDRIMLEKGLERLIAQYGKGSILWPLRVALSGQSASPDPYDIACALKQEEVLRRLHIAKEKLEHAK